MKRRFLSALLACLMVLSLAGCGEKTQSPSSAQGADAPAQTQTQADAAPDVQEAAERPAVEDNGGQFVRVDGKVWFRRYDDGALDESALWGGFLATRPTHAGSSTLCYYDEASGAVVEAMKDDGFGELWFGADGFYLSRSDGTTTEAYYKTLDGAESTLGEGVIAGVSDNGRFVAVQNGNALTVREGTERKWRIIGAAAFCALTDDGTLLYCDSDVACIERMDVGGQIEILGVLPDLPEGISSYRWEFEQCLLDGDDIWCTFGAYEGTGHFLAEPLVVRAKLDTPSSLEVIEDEATTEYPFVPKLYRDASGAVRRAEHAPGELEIAYESGDLCWYEGADAETELIASFLPQNDYSDDRWIEQGMEALGGAAYVIVAQAFRDAENDVGWRMAYRPGELRYLRVPLQAGATVEALDGKKWETPPAAADVYADFIGTWTLTATEVEGDRSDTLPDGTFELLEFRADGTAMITGSEYQNVFQTMEVLPTNSDEAGMGAYGLLFTGGTNDDMLWTFFEGDTLVGTVMIHFEADGGTDAYSRTGFYERSGG